MCLHCSFVRHCIRFWRCRHRWNPFFVCLVGIGRILRSTKKTFRCGACGRVRVEGMDEFEQEFYELIVFDLTLESVEVRSHREV